MGLMKAESAKFQVANFKCRQTLLSLFYVCFCHAYTYSYSHTLTTLTHPHTPCNAVLRIDNGMKSQTIHCKSVRSTFLCGIKFGSEKHVYSQLEILHISLSHSNL